MKSVEAVVAREKVTFVVDALKKVGVGGITIFEAKGWGKGKRPQMTAERGTASYTAEFNLRNYVITIVDDSLVDRVITAILDAAGTSTPGDGKIFVHSLDEFIDIGSKQKGIHAL